MNQVLLSVKDASVMLAVSKGTIRNLIKRGEIPHVQIGRRKLFVITDLVCYVAKKRVSNEGY